MGGHLSLTDCTGRRKGDTRNNIGQYELTIREKELVRTTWAKLAVKQDELSVDIFLRIFQLIPIAKELFPFKNAVGDALVEHPYLKGHAMRFFNAVGMTVLNLDAWEVILIPNLLTLGRQHANIQGFKHEYFESFAQAMNDVFKKYLGSAYTTETRRAWTKISSLITSTVEQGYREGQEINAKRTSQQPLKDRNSSTQNSAFQTNPKASPKSDGHVCPMDIDLLQTQSIRDSLSSTGLMSLEQIESRETESMHTFIDHEQSCPANIVSRETESMHTSIDHEQSCPANILLDVSSSQTTNLSINGAEISDRNSSKSESYQLHHEMPNGNMASTLFPIIGSNVSQEACEKPTQGN